MTEVQPSSSILETFVDPEISAPRYDMSPEEAKSMCGDFLNSHEVRLDTRFGCYIIHASSQFSNLGRHVEGKIFDEAFQNNPEIMDREYGPYEQASTFYVVVDHNERLPIGALRIIEDSEAGLKSLVDLPETSLGITPEQFYEGHDVKSDECVDIGTAAVEKDYRGRTFDFTPSLLLYRTLYVKTLQDPRYKEAVSIMDERIYNQLHNLGMPFRPIFNSQPFSYLDSKVSYAVEARTEDFLPSVSAKAAEYRRSLSLSKRYMAKMMQKLIDGNGLDHMMGYTR